jgi:hypothetical protein
MPRVLRCREYVYAAMNKYGDRYRCVRFRAHLGAHRDLRGDRWSVRGR